MATETNISNLKIHILTRAQYNELANSGGLNENEFYSVNDDIVNVPVEDVTVGGTSVVAGKIAVIPAIPAAPGTLNTTATTAQSTSSSEALSGSITLHKVSKTGSYNDLLNKPTIPSAPGTLNTTATTAQTTSSSEELSGNIVLHKVSKTGSYNDLNNTPTIDPTPLDGSPNAVSSSGVYSALQYILSQVVSFENVSTNQDGTLIISLTNGDTITVDLNHTHDGLLPEVTSSDNDKIMKVVGGVWTLSAGGQADTLPIASSSVLGGVMVGSTLSINSTTGEMNVGSSFPKYVLLADEAAYTALSTKDSGTLYLIPKE